jgi:hypothetical protein
MIVEMVAEEEKVDWVRGPKKINSKNVSLEKVEEAQKRGVNVEVDADNPDQTIVTKTVVKGIPAPKEQDQS